MRNIFELTKLEQRVVIVIVTLLVAIAFARHAWQTKSEHAVKTPVAERTASDHEPDKPRG